MVRYVNFEYITAERLVYNNPPTENVEKLLFRILLASLSCLYRFTVVIIA